MPQGNTELLERVAELEQEISNLLDNLSLCKGNELAAQVEDLTAQLATARQKVWEEAADLVEEYRSTGGTTSPGQATICKIAVRCREQAKKAPRI